MTTGSETNDLALPYLDGRSTLALHPEPAGSDHEWYINDHCFIEDSDGVLHFLGANNPYPWSDPTPYSDDDLSIYSEHPYIGHATSTDPQSHWDRQPHALIDEREGGHLGAPGVVWVDERDEYVMIFKTGIKGRPDRLEIATSPDLYTWSRSETFVLPDLPSGTRDPCIRPTETGEFLLYLTDGDAVFVTETRDFTSFRPVEICLELEGVESPFVVYRDGLWYLFATHAHRHYYETLVFVSDDHTMFQTDQIVTTLYTHAPEIVSYRGHTYISSCGPEDQQAMNEHGLYLAKLDWASP